MPQEYPTQCWSCLGEFDAVSAVWCTCSAKTPTKLCPFCFHCFCPADPQYHEKFWSRAPEELREEREMLKKDTGAVGENLIRSNLLNTNQLVSALKWQSNSGGSLDDAVVDLGFVSRGDLEVVSQGAAKGGATIDLSHTIIDATLVKEITVEVCMRKKILPVSKEQIGETPVLTLAMAGGADVDTIDQIQSLTSCRIIPMSAAEGVIFDKLRELFPDEMNAALNSTTKPTAATGGPAPAPEVELTEIPLTEIKEPPQKPKKARGGKAQPSAPAARPVKKAAAAQSALPAAEVAPPPTAPRGGAPAALQKILAEAISRKASSIQVEVRGAALNLYYRIDGNLMRAKPPAGLSPEAFLNAVAEGASLPAGSGPASGRIPVKSGGRKMNMVVRRQPFQGGESLFIQVVDSTVFTQDLEHLGVSALDRDRILKGLALPSGLIVLSAPPHNDAEVTRHSLMAGAGREGRRVLAINSPHLLEISGVRHQELPFPPDTGRLTAAIDSAQGAEVIFIPDIETSEIAALAVEKASSCLVVASIQARRASQTPAALLWHQLDAADLSSALKLIINQRLVRRICEGCRTPLQAADRVLKMMGLTADELLDLKVFQGSGCDRCGAGGQGYRGRVALFEVLEVNPDMGSLIAAAAPPGEIERLARNAGMSPLRAACLARVGQGVTTLEEFQKGNF